MTTFISAGDSFTYGNDLSDCLGDGLGNHSMHSWAALTAKNLNMEYVCTAKPGGSNSSIARRCLYNVEQSLKQNKKVVVGVMWTYIHRLEIHPKINIQNKKFRLDDYSTVSGHHSLSFEEKMKNFGLEMNDNRVEFFKFSHKTDELAGAGEISRCNLKFMSDVLYLIESLKSLLLLKYYLESNNINYFFIKASDDINIDNTYGDPYCEAFKQIADSANWLSIPNFYTWAKNNNFKIGFANHPLEEAHQAYAEQFIIPYVKPIMNVES